MCPSYLIWVLTNTHLSRFSFTYAWRKVWQTCLITRRWLSRLAPLSDISSRHGWTSLTGRRICSIISWKNAGADDNSKQRRLYRYKPRWVVITIWRFDSSSSSTWRYSSCKSSLKNTLPPNRRSNSLSICGRGYRVWSKYWLTNTLKSSQILTWLFGISTGTIGFVLNFALSRLLIMIKDPNRSSSASTLDQRGSNTGRGLNSLKFQFFLMCR